MRCSGSRLQKKNKTNPRNGNGQTMRGAPTTTVPIGSVFSVQKKGHEVNEANGQKPQEVAQWVTDWGF